MVKNMRDTLYFVSKDARLTTKKLGQLTRKSQQNASYILRSLEKKEIIRNYKTIIDPARFGFINVIVLYNFMIFDEEKIAELKAYLKDHHYVVKIEEVSQGADLMIEYSVPNLSFFNKKHRELLNKYKSILQSGEIYVVIVKHLYEKKYLIDNPDYDEIIMSGDRDIFVLNRHYRKVLNALRGNAREPVVKIAGDLGIDPKTVMNIRRVLEKNKIILKYTTTFDNTKVGVRRRHLFIEPAQGDPRETKKLLIYAQHHKSIVEAIKIIGQYEILLTIERNIKDKEVITDIRKNFQITKYKIIESDRVLRQDFIPDIL